MQIRESMRPRQLDDNKPLEIIKDIEEAKITSSADKVKELKIFETELIKAINHFDNRKKIALPKLLTVENNINEKNEKAGYSQKKKNQNNKVNDSIMPKYEIGEYKRPDHYIIYSPKEKDENKKQVKDYEAKSADYIFMEYTNGFITPEDLERIFSALENNIGKGEKPPEISEEKKIIEDNFAQYKNKSDTIIKYFNERRNELKKSLLRKFWRIQKSSDNYFKTTFKHRGPEKMKIRKNNQKKEDSYEKILEARDLCSKEILEIMQSLSRKVNLNKYSLSLEHLIFQAQIKSFQKNETISDDMIKIKGQLFEQIQELVSPLKDTEIEPPAIPAGGGHKHNHESGSGFHISKKEKKKEQEGNQNDLTSIDSLSHNRINQKEIIKRGNIDEEKKIIKTKNEDYFYPVKLDYLNDSKEEYKELFNKENNPLRVRVRLNRYGKRVFDRYIQSNNSMNPFDDDFNQKLTDIQHFGNNLTMNPFGDDTFEDLLDKYYEQQLICFNIFNEEEEEVNGLQSIKKSNSKLLNKKRNPSNN